MASIKTLPLELHIQILSLVTSFYDLTNVAQVCKLWNAIITEASVKSNSQYNYGVVPGSKQPTLAHKLLQLYAEDYVGTGGRRATSLRGIFFGCTIKNGATNDYFIHDSLSAEEGTNSQTKTTRLDISSFDVLNDRVCKFLSDDARGESVAWQTRQGYRSVIEGHNGYDSDEYRRRDSDIIKLWFDISCTFGNKPDEFYTQKLKTTIRKKFHVYEITTIRELVERARRRVRDAIRRVELRILEPYELRFELRSYSYGGEDDCFLKLSVNIYHQDEDYLKGNPFRVMRATRDRLSRTQFNMRDYIL
ncbi:hypothetical protein TWF730_001468 [Orbilia blumenaviensis]|uniref:F-box domain-containing protein n=1 Tax=Orbilia blumenaviensis TaxID=1796055 RepID=A0AAV9UIN9_9PEZI